ncbi:chelonianin-like [Emydura macquarii macquarii]|uniref:chelonianin-like n=1 Tax=Emydura macquarii macquarii TaxID=1129001 RepID=UPI00352AEA4D
MESGGIFLLLGLFALWAELPAVAGQGDKRDICRLPAEQGPCEARISRYFYNPASRQCEHFIYGGCKGNENNFKTKAECVRACRPADICRLPAEVGPCTAAIPRWFYNWHAKKCEKFSYGGCNGNKNNFETKANCLEACAGQGAP